MLRTGLMTLNILFFAVHTALVVFNVFGWIPRRTRRWNLVCLLATAASWFVMGLWHGIGYCILTDWHWQVRHALGFKDSNLSYIQLMVQEVSGWTPSDSLASNVAAVTFVVSLTMSIGLNIRDRRLNLATKGKNPDLTSAS